MAKPAGEADLRIPAPFVLALTVVALVLTARHGAVDQYVKALFERGLLTAVVPYWEMSVGALAGHLLYLAGLAWLTVVFAGCGLVLCRAAGLRFSNPWEGLAFSFALGSGAWAYLFLFLGLAGLLYRPLLLALLIAGGLYALWEFRKGIPAKDGSFLAPFRGDWRVWAFALLLLVHLVLLLPYALVPETFYDSLEYHFGLPNLYLLRHRIGPTPDNSFSGVPSIPGMLYGWGLVLDRWGIVAHLLNFSFLAWIVVALVGLGTRLGSPVAGLAGGAIFSLIPAAASVSYMSTIELGWGFYQLLCFPAFLSALESPERARERKAWLVVCGLCLGLAMATKYLAWALPFALLTLLFGLRRSDAGLRCGLRELGLVFGTGALTLLPWVIKNIVFYRNPIFPFLHEFWASASEVMPGWRYLGSGATFQWDKLGLWGYAREYLLAPWRMVLYQGKPADSLGAVVLALAPLLALVRLPDRARLLGWFALGCWLPFSFIVHLPRYFVPFLPLLSLLVGLAVCRPGVRWLRNALAACVCVALLAGGLALWRWTVPRTRWPVFTGRKSFAEFLSHADEYYYPAPLYPAAEYLDKHAAADARVLVFGESRGFYLRRDHIASTPMQVTVLERWANASASGRELKRRMEARGITHIIVNHADIVRQWSAFRFSRKGKRSLDEFWRRYTLKVFQAGPERFRPETGRDRLDRWIVVYRVLSEDEAERDHPTDDLFEHYKAQEG
ncbi:MAG: hypothetical protein ABII00_10595 [Elusimicrobiota bacterium]